MRTEANPANPGFWHMIQLSHVLNLLQQLNEVFGQAVRSSAFPQQREVLERWLAVVFIAFGNEGRGPQRRAADVLGIQPYRPIPPPRNAFRGAQTNKIAACDLVKDTPNLRWRIGAQISIDGPASGKTLEVETQPVSPDPPRAPLARTHTAPVEKRAVVHIGAIGQVPDFLWGGPMRRMPCTRKARRRPWQAGRR